MAVSKSKSSSNDLINLAWVGAILYGVGLFVHNAYEIRLLAIKEYGPVIHGEGVDVSSIRFVCVP